MKPLIALRIDIPGYSARTALPVLVDLLRAHGAGASFTFALGPDWLGRSLARHCAGTLKLVRDACFDLGTYGWKPGQWKKRIERKNATWVTSQLDLMAEVFTRVFEVPPTLHAAPGWCSSPHAMRLTQRLGFACASDTRGRHPFIPVWNGEIVRCPQIPVTLPTLDELAETSQQQDPSDRINALLALTRHPPMHGHVFSLQATRAIGKDPSSVRQLLDGWRDQGYEVTSIQSLASQLIMDKLPRHEIVVGKVPGRKDSLLLQGDEFLSAWRTPT